MGRYARGPIRATLLAAFMPALILFASSARADSKGEIAETPALSAALRFLSDLHPAVRSAREEWQGAVETGKFAGRRYPDPEFMYMNMRTKGSDLTLLPEPDYAARSAEANEYRLMQPIPFPGRLTTEASIARIEADLKRVELAEARNRLAAEFLALLIELRSIRRTLRFTREFVGHIETLARSAATRNAAGVGSLSDAAMARVRQGAFQERVLDLAGRERALSETFAYYLPKESSGESHSAAHSGAGHDATARAVPPAYLAELGVWLGRLETRARARTERPEDFSLDIARARLSGDMAERERTLARFDYLPDFSIFARLREEEGRPGLPRAGRGTERTLAAGLSIRVPLWSALANPARVEGLAFRQKAAASRVDESIGRVRSEFRAAHSEHRAHHERVNLFRARQIPRARVARDSVLLAYRTERADFTAVLEAWDDLYVAETELIRLEAMRDRHLIALASIVNAILPDNEPARSSRSADPRGEEE